MTKQATTPGILILAAGKGQRFQAAGGQGNKLLACVADEQGTTQTLLEMTLANALQSGLPVQVITRPEYTDIQALAQQKGVAVTLIASEGSGETIAAGVRATPGWSGWLIQPGDMAWVTTADHLQVADRLLAGDGQTRLMWQDVPGHPVGFSRDFQAALCQLQGDEGARQIIQRERITLVQAHAGVIRDADLPE